jgi:alkanesulfonate monooxygenase SsuD/methylene tetrahydromethanopterin reductase-like flavin-dependent oxidoreductase (luciferase family)
MNRARIGIQLPEVERVVAWPEYVLMARAAEESGFASIWMGDHLLYRGDGRPERGPWEAWTLLSALAAETERVDLGPLVACLAFHPPAVIAKMAATINEVSAGRFILGIGAGWNKPEFDAFGLPFDQRGARFEEAFQVIRGMASGERVTLKGRFHTVDDVVSLPPARFPQRIMVGSTGERVLRATLPHVDWWNTWFDWFGNSAEGFASANDRISRLAVDVGRDPNEVKRSACLLVRVDDDAIERPRPDTYPEATPSDVGRHVDELSDAGADEVILVANPINETSIRRLGDALN